MYDSENKWIVHRDVKFVPGFFKVVDINAADNKVCDANAH
jgi:DNA topoisomerase-2